MQGHREGGKGTKFPGRRITVEGPNDCGGRQKSQQCHKYFLQYSTFVSARPRVQRWGGELASRPERYVTSLHPCIHDKITCVTYCMFGKWQHCQVFETPLMTNTIFLHFSVAKHFQEICSIHCLL